jgi:hypothetical protein
MIVINNDCKNILAMIEVLGLSGLHRAGLIDEEFDGHRASIAGDRKANSSTLLRLFLGQTAARESDHGGPPFIHCRSPTDHEVRIVISPVSVSHWTGGFSSLVPLAARHAVWSAIIDAATEARFTLRPSHLPSVAERSPGKTIPSEPYSVDLAQIEPACAWHILRIMLGTEPTAAHLLHLAVLQECDRVAAVIERTTGVPKAVEMIRGVSGWGATIGARAVNLTAERFLGRMPVLGTVVGGSMIDSSAAERYLIRAMTEGR